MYIGTANFVSLRAAIRYYSDYGCDAKDVDRKIEDGEIKIGRPEIKEGDRLLITDRGTRYVIRTADHRP